MLKFFTGLFLFFTQICFSQWQFQNPAPTGFNLTNIIKINNTSALALGRENTILKTTNKGANWINCNYSNDTNSFNGAYIFDDNNFIVVGNNGSIIRTNNAGATWTKINLQYNYFLNRVSFVNASTGFITGTFGGVLKSTDGGSTWSWINFNFGFSDLSIINQSKYVSFTPYGSVYITTNSGVNWIAADYSPASIVKSMHFINSSTGYLANQNNFLFKTTNEGNNWVQVGTTPVLFNQIFFKDASNAFACSTTDSAFYYSTNSGTNWSRIPFSNRDYLKRFIFFDDFNTAGITTSYRILRSSNYLTGWNSISEDIFSYISGNSFGTINFSDINTGTVSCRSGFFITTNSGTNWSYKYISEESRISESIVNNNNIISIGENFIANFNSRAAIFRSTNNGNNWSTVYLAPTDNTGCTDIAMINANTGFVCIDGNANSSGILKTTNGGINWSLLNLGDSLQPIAISFNNNLGVVTTRTKVLISTNTGESWNIKYISSSTLTDINLQNNKIYLLSDTTISFITRVKIIKSTDFGNTWAARIAPEGLSYSPSAVYMLNDNIGFLSTLGSLYYTTDYFSSVTKVFNAPINIDHVEFSFINENSGWMLSRYNGFLWKTTNKGGIIGIRKLDTRIVPKEFVLHNNYPNPFNPVTTIKFSLPVSTHVNLKIFDIQGREITQLINDYLSFGNYEYNYDASSLSSGIYFYQLATASASTTKKMILIK